MPAEPPFRHVAVLADAVVSQLAPGPGDVVLDATVGGGGHAERLAEMGARVIGLDVDPAAVAAATERLARFGDRATVVRANFTEARGVLDRLGVDRVQGVLADLGISSHQLDTPERGFSFAHDGPLDLRLSGQGETAADLLRRLSEADLARILRDFGEERFAHRIARAIQRDPPSRTVELASRVARAIPRPAWPRHIHPATRTFQALRIAVNRELEELDALLSGLPALLAPGGRAVVIAFHSLEDRRVKQAFRDRAGRCRCPPRLPVCACGAGGGYVVRTRKPVVASETEIATNPRARSARLRVLERQR